MKLKTGAIVVLSWPDTRVCNASSWYDGLMKIIGVCKSDGYYNIGHAALLLIDYRNGNVRYFDFGRYQTPFGYGRVRDVQSDPDLEIVTKAVVDNGEIINLKNIILELNGIKSTHGDGKLVCSATPDINFDLAIASAKSIQRREAIPYGPFQPFGSNCSRFVASIYRAGFTSYFKKLRITNWYFYFHSPTSNIISTHDKENVFVVERGEFRVENSMLNIFLNKSKFDSSPQIGVTKVQNDLPESVFCLTGIGSNAFFQLSRTEKSHLFKVRRYSEYGNLEFDELFQLQSIGFDIIKPYIFDYISNGIAVKIKQDEKVFVLKNVKCQNKKPIKASLVKRRLFGRG